MVLIHRDGSRTDLEILRRLKRLANLFRIAAACTLQSIDEHLARIVAESREDVRCTVVLLLVRFDEALHLGVLLRVMRAEEGVVQRVRAGDVDDLRVVPAVRAEDRRIDAHLTRLLDDLADFLVVSRHEHDVSVRRLELRERRLEVLILLQEGFFHDDLAARRFELLLEHLREVLRVVRAVVDVDDCRLRLEIFRGEGCHHFALLRVDEAAAEDVGLDLAVLHCRLGTRRARCDDRHLRVRRRLRLGEHETRRRRADDDLDVIVRDELRCRIDRLRRFRLVVDGNKLDLLAIDAAGLIRLIDCELQALDRGVAVVRDVARKLEVRADLDRIARLLRAAACKDAAQERRSENSAGEPQALLAENHENPLQNS